MIEISSGGGSAPDPAAILEEVASAGGSAVSEIINGTSVVVQPQEFQLAGKNATLFGLQDTMGGLSTISDYILVELTDGRSLMITLEGPADTWSASQTELEGILSTIRLP